MPRINEILFPAPRGGHMSRSSWPGALACSTRTSQEFYELKYRAIQWMIDPTDDGGLGLDPPTVAQMVGHNDGGYLIATAYTKLAQHRALTRALRTMNTYQQNRATPPQALDSHPRQLCNPDSRWRAYQRGRMTSPLRHRSNPTRGLHPLQPSCNRIRGALQPSCNTPTTRKPHKPLTSVAANADPRPIQT
jgi:hypothetical protein